MCFYLNSLFAWSCMVEKPQEQHVRLASFIETKHRNADPWTKKGQCSLRKHFKVNFHKEQIMICMSVRWAWRAVSGFRPNWACFYWCFLLSCNTFKYLKFELLVINDITRRNLWIVQNTTAQYTVWHSSDSGRVMGISSIQYLQPAVWHRLAVPAEGLSEKETSCCS